MKIKEKECKAIGKARGFEGCGKMTLVRIYGLCTGCYSNWLLNTPEGKEKLSKSILQAPKIREKEENKGWKSRQKATKEKLKTKKDYEKELEYTFNAFIRERDKHLECISCEAKAGNYKLTAGHFYPAGSYKNLRFNEDNVQGQCWWNCNKNQSGNLHKYRIRLIERIGEDRVQELDRLAQTPRHYTVPELIEMKVNYKEKIRKLKA